MISRPVRLLFATLSVLALSACKQDDKQIDANQYPQEMATGYCDAVFACNCEDYPYSNISECYAEVKDAYTEATNEAYAAGLSYDSSCPEKELERIDSLACKISLPEGEAGECVAPCYAWHGNRSAGSLCEFVATNAEAGVAFSNCAQGLVCLAGVCANPCQLGDLPGLGEACPNFLCEEGATCDLQSQLCVVMPTYPGPGEPCKDGLCDPERAVCVPDANVCASLPSVGEECVQGQCDAESLCGSADICVARPALACGLLAGGVGGDGDGDPTTTGDGDGDPTTGDGDGDGDGDPTTTGDGDGDPTTTGDGDGDPGNLCGWDGGSGWYGCGFVGEDPDGVFPIECPANLVEGGDCGSLTGEGCCDADGNNWYCGDDGMTQSVVLEVCG